MHKDLTAAGATPIVLALLAEREDYGYALIRRLKMCSGESIPWAEGMLYPILHRLCRQGYLQSQSVRQENGRRRTYYRITDEGFSYMLELRRDWGKIDQVLAAAAGRAAAGHTGFQTAYEERCDE
jgi:PadR family transcriptional regulator, regulatory protein PadR